MTSSDKAIRWWPTFMVVVAAARRRDSAQVQCYFFHIAHSSRPSKTPAAAAAASLCDLVCWLAFKFNIHSVNCERARACAALIATVFAAGLRARLCEASNNSHYMPHDTGLELGDSIRLPVRRDVVELTNAAQCFDTSQTCWQRIHFACSVVATCDYKPNFVNHITVESNGHPFVQPCYTHTHTHSHTDLRCHNQLCA